MLQDNMNNMEQGNVNTGIPTEPTPAMGVHNTNVRLIVSIVFLVAVVILGFLLSKNFLGPKAPPLTDQPAPGLEVTRMGSVVPEGFLLSLPLEIDNIVESSKVIYAENGLTHYNVTYSTASSTNEKYSQYYRYFAQNGFYTSGSGSVREEGRIFSTRGNESVLVMIALKDGVQMVSVNYIQKDI